MFGISPLLLLLIFLVILFFVFSSKKKKTECSCHKKSDVATTQAPSVPAPAPSSPFTGHQIYAINGN